MAGWPAPTLGLRQLHPQHPVAGEGADEELVAPLEAHGPASHGRPVAHLDVFGGERHAVAGDDREGQPVPGPLALAPSI